MKFTRTVEHFTNGEKLQEEFLDGKRHGITRRLNKDGNIIYEAISEHGERKEIRLFFEGNLFDLTIFSNNKMSYAFRKK